MEGDDQRRRHFEQSNFPIGYASDYGAHGSNMSNLQHLRGSQVAESSDHFRQGQLLTTRTSSSTPLAAGAGPPQDIGAFAYSQGQHYQTPQMQAPSFQYQSEYSREPQRQRFPQYSSQMYNIPQQPQPQSTYNVLQQTPTQSPYEPVGQFQPRQAAAAEVLSSQFGVPPPYFSGSDAPSITAPPAMAQAYQSAQYPQALQYNPPSALGHSTLASSYPTMPPGFNQASGGSPNPTPLGDTAANNNDRFYRAIGETNDRTYRGMLIQAGSSLMQITEWLLTNVVHLGTFLSISGVSHRLMSSRSHKGRPLGSFTAAYPLG